MNGPTEWAYGTDPHKGLISLCAHDTPQGQVTATTLPLKKASACSPCPWEPLPLAGGRCQGFIYVF